MCEGERAVRGGFMDDERNTLNFDDGRYCRRGWRRFVSVKVHKYRSVSGPPEG